MIYAIWAVGTPYIKFGVTNGISAKKRLETMQTGCPFELEILATCEGGPATESHVHLRLVRAGAFHRGEWFKICEEAETVVDQMKAGTLPKVAEKEIEIGQAPNHSRLGACLQYSNDIAAKLGHRRPRKLASDNPNSPASPSKAPGALQPN